MKTLSPIFSIVIPTFNSEATLHKCITSIITQTFSDYEVLIIDGVSTDNTLSILNSFSEPRIKILSELDNGIYDAMNKGIKLAKGRWIYFLGSDDFIYSQDVLMLINNIASRTNQYVIYGNVMCDNVGSNGKIYDGIFSLEKLLHRNICHQSIFYRNEIFHKIGSYNIEYVVNADWDFNLKCRSAFKFQYVDIIIAFFSSGGHSSTGTDDLFFQSYLDNLARYFFWQFYKKDFYQLTHQVLEKQLHYKHYIHASIIFLQMELCYFRISISKIKRKICSRL